jgi:hypothetical protein
MALYSVPVKSSPDQQFNIIMPLAGINTAFKVRLRYNTIADYWVLTLSDKSGNLIVDSLPLVTGVASAVNLFGQFQHLGIGGMAIVKMGNNSLDYPNDSTLGTDFMMLWGDFADFQVVS